MQNKISLNAKIALVIACFFWSISFIASKIALGSALPLTVVMLRLIVSSICFLFWFLFSGIKFKYYGLKWLAQLLLLSFFGTGLHYSIQTIGLQYTTASNASLYAITGPIAIFIIAIFFMGEKLNVKKTLGFVLSIIGVFIVMGLDMILSIDVKAHVWGDFLVFISVFMWGIFTVLSKNMMKKMSALELISIVTFMGALYMIPISIFEMRNNNFSILSIKMDAWLAIFFLGITCSFLATILYILALERTESQKVGVYLYTIPPMTYISAVLFLGENIGINLILGSVFVLLGVYITENG